MSDTLPTYPQTTLTTVRARHFCAEASQLRLPPGKFPVAFRIDGAFGNNFPFEFSHADDAGTHFYEQQLGQLTIAILND